MTIDKIDFLKKLKSLLKYHEVIGIRHYPRNKEVESFCSIKGGEASAPGLMKGTSLSPGGVKAVSNEAGTESTDKKVTLSDIEIEVAACRACDLHRHRIYPVAGKGGTGPRVLVVGDWLWGDADGHLEKELIFGVEQDQMLDRMFAAIKLPSAEIFVTNVIKCAVPLSCHPAADHVRCCMSFLRRQISILAPEMICTMGMIAAKAVVDRSQSLSQLRGTFYQYETENNLHIPVLVTYHPTFLLQNPEMKKATWADLQLLAKKLKQP